MFVHFYKNPSTKLDPCALKCVFLGYFPHQKGYWCYFPPSQRLFVFMDVSFSQTEMYFASSVSVSSLQRESLSVEESNWMTLLQDSVDIASNVGGVL